MSKTELLLNLLILVSLFAVWLIFARVTVTRIDKRLAAKGIVACSWDGVGFRIPMYAGLLLFPQNAFWLKIHPLINSQQIAAEARSVDTAIARLFWVVTLCWFGALFFSVCLR